jgi:hypothetical protein
MKSSSRVSSCTKNGGRAGEGTVPVEQQVAAGSSMMEARGQERGYRRRQKDDHWIPREGNSKAAHWGESS